MNGRVAALVAAGLLSVSANGFAQTVSAQAQVAPGVAPVGAGVVTDPALAGGRAVSPELPLRFGRNVEHSLGARFWIWNTPAWMVGLFAHVANDWSGPITFSPGLEYVYRKGSLDLVVGLQYTSLATPAPNVGLIRGRSENDVALERIESSLWTFSANVLFLWSSRINDWFEIQYGTGVGVSAVGGDLYRTQVAPNASGGYSECTNAERGRTAYCDASNNHYATFDANGQVTGRFSEPRLTDSASGSIPPVVPWLSLPHVALHFRPHRNFDVRVDGGFAVIGFYGGVALHYVF
jgi:hypothetical protein